MQLTQLKDEIMLLKKQKDVCVLAHYYAREEVQQIADVIGDSYYLSKIAMQRPEKVLLFCGVYFMAESAKLLNPEKIVLISDKQADCPMAHMVEEKRIEDMRRKYKDLAVVCYINSTAKIKALSDVCVTSANAVSIVKQLPQKNIFFIPDYYLGSYVKKQAPEKNILLNDGYCPIHKMVTKELVMKQKTKYPTAKVLVHPECQEEVVEIADYTGSTSQLIEYAANSKEETFIICTECGILYELKRQNPKKKFYLVYAGLSCNDMKLITLEKIHQSILTLESKVVLEHETVNKANKALQQMHDLTK